MDKRELALSLVKAHFYCINGYILGVGLNNRTYVSLDGNINKSEYKITDLFHEDMAIVRIPAERDNCFKTGFIDGRTGKLIYESDSYSNWQEFAKAFSYGFAPVKKYDNILDDYYWTYINKLGQTATSKRFKAASVFRNYYRGIPLGVVQLANDQFAFIDQKMNTLDTSDSEGFQMGMREKFVNFDYLEHNDILEVDLEIEQDNLIIINKHTREVIGNVSLLEEDLEYKLERKKKEG